MLCIYHNTAFAKLRAVPNDVPYIFDIRSELFSEVEPLVSEHANLHQVTLYIHYVKDNRGDNVLKLSHKEI